MNKIKEIMRKENFKTVLTLFSLFVVSGVLLILAGRSLGDPNSTILREQEVDGLVFKNATIEYVEGITTFTVEVENTLEDINLRYININFKDENDNSTRLVGYIGDNIKSKETKLIVASVDKDITNSIDITYSINKD
jgi:hypothetical protein